MIYKEKCEYILLHETTVDPDLAMEKRKILKENAVNIGGKSLMTLTYQQVLQDFGVRNWNGRIYSDNIVMNGLDKNPLVQHDLKMGTWTAEYGHPLIEKGTNELARQMTIFPPNACNTINKYWKEGKLKTIPFRNRCILLGVILVIVLLIEFFYFKDIQNGILSIISSRQ